MPNQLTLLDITKRFAIDGSDGLIEEALPRSAEIRAIPAIYKNEVSYKTLVRTAYQSAGFRSANEGVAASKSTWETAANGLQLAAFVNSLNAWAGFMVGSKYSVGRIKKLTEDNGCGLTDAKLSSLMALFPDALPDVIFLSRRSMAQLWKSRTATTVDGKPAPKPVEFWGIPLLETDAILNTEALTL